MENNGVKIKIPNKYKERFGALEKESDLSDCKYMLYFADGWTWDGYYSVPVKSKKEALQFLKETEKEFD